MLLRAELWAANRRLRAQQKGQARVLEQRTQVNQPFDPVLSGKDRSCAGIQQTQRRQRQYPPRLLAHLLRQTRRTANRKIKKRFS